MGQHNPASKSAGICSSSGQSGSVHNTRAQSMESGLADTESTQAVMYTATKKGWSHAISNFLDRVNCLPEENLGKKY